jgi:hypothetical protein
MRSPRTIVLSLGLALALGGCSFYAKKTPTPTAKGPLKGINTVINDLASDAGSTPNETAICNSVFSTALKQRLNKAGGCIKIVTNQLATVSNTTLTIKKYGFNPSHTTGTAVVQSPLNGKQHLFTLHLVNQPKGGWRISSIS